MTLPNGISTATVTFGRALGALGSEAKITGTVVIDRPVVWSATGDAIYAIPDPVAASGVESYLSFVVPHVDQEGFVDANGEQVTMFAYTLKAEITFAGTNRTTTITKPFQPLVGQSVIDLDLVPGGSIVPGVTAPQASVYSVAGETGVIEASALRTALGALGIDQFPTELETALPGALPAALPDALPDVLDDLLPGKIADPEDTVGQALSAQIADAIDPAKYANAATAANTKRFLGKMRRATSDASLLIVSDSTGNATNEWAYLTAQHIAAEFPAWSVQLAFWDETSGTAYQATTTVRTGTNGRTLTVWVASKAGGDPGYFLGFRWAAAIAAIDPDLMLMSHGHNMGDPTLIDQRPLMLQFTEEFAATFPRAGVVLIAQNPTKTSGRTTWQAVRATVWEEIASLRGYGFIDVHQAFVDFGDWQTALMLDNDHPNNAGSAVWAAVVSAAFTDTDQPSAMVLPPPPLLAGAQDYITNGDFSAWDSTNPDGWTINLATTSKDTTNFESATRGMKLTASGSSGIAEATQDVSLTTRKHLRSQLVTLGVRVFVPASNTATVRIALQDSTGGANIRNADLPANTRDRYVWMFVSKRIDAGATYIRPRLMARTSGTATVEATFDRAVLVKGALPADRMEKTPGPAGESGPESPSSFDFLSTLGRHPVALAAAATTGNLGVTVANQAILVPVKAHRNFLLSVLRWVSRTTGGNYDIGIYDNTGAKLWSKGSAAWPTSSTSAAIVETVSPAVALTAGSTYWVAFASDATTGQLQMLSVLTAVAELMKLADASNYARVVGSAFPLPSSITIGATISGRIPAVTLAEA